MDLATQETVSNLLAIQEVIRQYKIIVTGVADGSRIKLTDTLINVDIEELYKVINNPGGIRDLLNKYNLGLIIAEAPNYTSWVSKYETTIKSGFRHKTLDENGDVGYVSNKQEDMDRERIFKNNKMQVDSTHDDIDTTLATAYTTATVLEELVDIMHGDLKSLDDIFNHFNLDEIDDIKSNQVLPEETLGGERVSTGIAEGFLQGNMNILFWLKDSGYFSAGAVEGVAGKIGTAGKIGEGASKAKSSAKVVEELENLSDFPENMSGWVYKPSSLKNYLENKDVYDNPKYFDQKTGEIKWPENDGFIGEINIKKLKPGDIIDRYGNEYGRYTSPAGTPFEQRSLSPGSKEDVYHKYKVRKEFEVKVGKVGPWFDEPGGGQQYFSDKTIDELIKKGYIKED